MAWASSFVLSCGCDGDRLLVEIFIVGVVAYFFEFVLFDRLVGVLSNDGQTRRGLGRLRLLNVHSLRIEGALRGKLSSLLLF